MIASTAVGTTSRKNNKHVSASRVQDKVTETVLDIIGQLYRAYELAAKD